MPNDSNTHLHSQLAETQRELAKVKADLTQLKAEYQEFVYIISHDLSAPLRQIEGFSEMVLERHKDDFDDKSKRHFDFILKAGHSIRNILDDLTGYSRIIKRDEPFTDIDLNVIISSNLAELSSVIESSSASITIDTMPIVKGDEELISQMFYHLIHNALHYQLPTTPANITLSVDELDNFWQFCITDDGIGIPENIHEKIFKMFRRGVSEKKYTGAGVGLTYVQKILTKHQGSIWLKSEKGIGSSFYFTLRKA